MPARTQVDAPAEIDAAGAEETRPAATRAFLRTASLLRPHIVLIAALAAAVFGQLFDGRPNWRAALWVGFDWLLLNFWNRLADTEEDRLNHVLGAELAAAHPRLLFALASAAFALSLGLTAPLGLWFSALRLGFQVIGFAYNFRLLPGRTRLKELLGVKNASAAVLFVLSCIGYPVLLRQGPRPLGLGELACLSGFFFSLEMTYELFYDLRDAAGDRRAGLRTVPVCFGEPTARRVIAALLGFSTACLAAGAFSRALGFTEALLIAAPIQQVLVLRFWLRSQVTGLQAVGVTYLGAAQLASFLVWTGAGLPLWPMAPPW